MSDLIALLEADERGLERAAYPNAMAVIGKMADKDRFRIQEIQDKIRRVLMDEWDPIGVNDVPEAADEYDRYIGGIYGLIQRGVPEDQISEHLRRLEIDEMGMVDAQGLPLFPTEKRDQVASSLRRLFSQ